MAMVTPMNLCHAFRKTLLSSIALSHVSAMGAPMNLRKTLLSSIALSHVSPIASALESLVSLPLMVAMPLVVAMPRHLGLRSRRLPATNADT